MTALMSTYARYPVGFTRGDGSRMTDEKGKSYLDFLAGIGVNNLGHCHPKVVEAIRAQAGTLIHTSNLYRIPLQEEAAAKLTGTCFADQAFFSNSGAEANEAAIKLARKCMKDRGMPGRYEIVTAEKSFHGRTLATLAATGQAKVKVGFEPLTPGFRHVPYNDLDALEKSVSSYTAAIMLEPIQGEAGVRIPDPDYIAGAREIADNADILLILDEVQCGMGRTGKFWAHQHGSAIPDIMTVSKALASGVPMGACLAIQSVADSFTQGSHGSTFGGNPLACAAANATLDVMLEEGFLAGVAEKGAYFLEKLQEIAAKHKRVKEARGHGMMLSLELNQPAEEAAAICLQRGLLLNCALGTNLRLLPPLTASREEIDEAVSILDGVLIDLF